MNRGNYLLEEIVVFFVEAVKHVFSYLVVEIYFVRVNVGSDFVLELVYQRLKLPHRRHKLLIQRILLDLAELIRQS